MITIPLNMAIAVALSRPRKERKAEFYTLITEPEECRSCGKTVQLIEDECAECVEKIRES